MSKRSKQERKAAREAQRAAQRRAERQRNIFTGIVIGIVVLLGGVLIWVSLDRGPDDDELAELLEQLEAGQTPGDEGVDDRPVACGAEEPPEAGEDKPTFEEPGDALVEGERHFAVVDTSCGRVVIELDAERAPANAGNFAFLAQQGFFDGLEIFRHAEGIDALQTGAGTNDGTWQIGYTLPDELAWAEDEGYPPGAVAMANAGPESAGSQFFFVYGEAFDDAIEQGTLGPTYTRFGTVVEGLDVLQEIAAIPVEGETPQERVYMERVAIHVGDGPPPPEEEPQDGDGTEPEQQETPAPGATSPSPTGDPASPTDQPTEE